MKILITGAGGQLGRALPAALRRHQVTAADRPKLDISDLSAVRAAIAQAAPDLVINAAAYTNVDRAEAESEQAFRTNAVGARNLALAGAKAGAAMLHVSTDFVFDGAAARPYHEYDRVNPLSVYAASKAAGEAAVRELNPRHYIVRTAWLYGGEGRSFVNRMLALANQPRIRVADDEIGSPTFAPHLTAAIAALIETEAWGTYHLAGQGGASRYELIREVFSKLGLRTEIVPVAHTEFGAAARRPLYSVLTTIQEPRIVLPHWRDGVADFAASCTGSAANR